MHRNGCLLIQLHIIIFALLNSFMDSFGSLSDDSLNINISGAGLWYLRFKGWLFTRGPCAHDVPSWICGLNMNSSNQYEMRWKTHVCFILARSKNVISYSHNLSRHRCVCHMNSFACYTRWFVRSLQILRFFFIRNSMFFSSTSYHWTIF